MNMTFYDNMIAAWDDKDGQERAKQRWKYFEVDGYRKLSNIEKTPYNYSSRTEVYMLIYYLNNSQNFKHLTYVENEIKLQIEENIDNPEINWENIFDYFDNRRLTESEYLDEVDDVMSVLEPYREQLIGNNNFVLY